MGSLNPLSSLQNRRYFFAFFRRAGARAKRARRKKKNNNNNNACSAGYPFRICETNNCTLSPSRYTREKKSPQAWYNRTIHTYRRVVLTTRNFCSFLLSFPKLGIYCYTLGCLILQPSKIVRLLHTTMSISTSTSRPSPRVDLVIESISSLLWFWFKAFSIDFH